MSQLIETRDGKHLRPYTLQKAIELHVYTTPSGKKPLGQGQAGIWIMNKHNGRCAHGHFVARPSTLGNPYALTARETRGATIARYRHWLRREWVKHGAVRAALYRLAQEYVQTGSLYLVCWCAPKPCHAEVIRDAVLGIVRRGSGQ